MPEQFLFLPRRANTGILESFEEDQRRQGPKEPGKGSGISARDTRDSDTTELSNSAQKLNGGLRFPRGQLTNVLQQC